MFKLYMFHVAVYKWSRNNDFFFGGITDIKIKLKNRKFL